ncbi:glutathione S-transferase N-terminal domain-containing protein [uncultured Hyphomonas sp.]|uniref:glutathione S-transferase N-terminal domain-containing protein n=1 Tax=uncultured Hyphomonas sp. TaxID=225298 RepID=UPI002AAB4C66|nr:glutathione S-transferase N-terminal domain-containing protein [uncultured Hyphomonas sp.]
MKLYTHPGASSLSVHILLRETGLPFELEVVDVTAKRRPDGSDYRSVAPRGMVPMLELDGGVRLTENIVIQQYICDTANRFDLMPASHTIARYRVMEWQSFVAAELHKSFIPLSWDINHNMRKLVVNRIVNRLGFVEGQMSGTYLTGDTFTAADAYCFVIASWTKRYGIDISHMPRLSTYLRRIAHRASVLTAIGAEGPGLVSIDQFTPLP